MYSILFIKLVNILFCFWQLLDSIVFYFALSSVSLWRRGGHILPTQLVCIETALEILLYLKIMVINLQNCVVIEF